MRTNGIKAGITEAGGRYAYMERGGSIGVSVVIPAHNEAGRLGKCLAAILKQKDAAFPVEVLVVDNASADGTAGIASEFGVAIVLEPRRGRAKARNAGIAASMGDIILFLDADCVPQAGWLEALIGGFEDPGVGCAAGEIVNEFTGGPLAEYMAGKGYLSQADNLRHPFLPFAATGNVAFRREVLERIGGFDESLSEAEDADLCWRMQIETNYKIKLVPEAVVIHRMDVSPRGVFRQKRRHGLGAVMLYKKYRHEWKPTGKSVKTLYWEYRSLARRALRLGWRGFRGWVGIPERSALPFDENQIFFELGWKLGLVQGSLRHRVLFL